MKLYNIAYYAGMAWFVVVLFLAATGGFKGAGAIAFFIALAIASAPCAALWTWKRWATGTWIN